MGNRLRELHQNSVRLAVLPDMLPICAPTEGDASKGLYLLAMASSSPTMKRKSC
jgi:hypothetical protein